MPQALDPTSDVSEQRGGGLHANIFDLAGRPLFWLVLVGLLSSIPMWMAAFQETPAVPPIYMELPDFELVNQDGKPFSKTSMFGKVWIADFVFTRCPTVCKGLSTRMSEMQVRLRHANKQIQLVSFSVDPEYDTPSVLREYGKTYRAVPWLWTFVTGPLKSLEEVVVKGFKMSLERDEEAPDNIMAITHGSKFVLIDRLARIRGYYDADDIEEDRMLRDASLIANLEKLIPGAADAAAQNAASKGASQP